MKLKEAGETFVDGIKVFAAMFALTIALGLMGMAGTPQKAYAGGCDGAAENCPGSGNICCEDSGWFSSTTWYEGGDGSGDQIGAQEAPN